MQNGGYHTIRFKSKNKIMNILVPRTRTETPSYNDAFTQLRLNMDQGGEFGCGATDHCERDRLLAVLGAHSVVEKQSPLR
jgi:hypothetical protein